MRHQESSSTPSQQTIHSIMVIVQMDPSGKSKGPPPAVKKLLGMFGSGREEDRMVGYLSFLKMGPKLLRFLPGKSWHICKQLVTVSSRLEPGLGCFCLSGKHLCACCLEAWKL